MPHSRQSTYISLSISVTLLFVLATYKAGVLAGIIFIAAGILGYLNIFGAFRAALALVKGRKISKLTATVAALAAVGTWVLCYSGYWAPVALCTGSWLVIDGIALRFQGAPVGASAGGP